MIDNLLANITLTNVSVTLLFILGLIKGVKELKKSIKEWLENILDSKFSALSNQMREVETKIDKIDMETCKNFLVRLLGDIQRGDHLTDSEIQRFWEEYQHYIDNKGNSYVTEWVNRLRKEEKL